MTIFAPHNIVLIEDKMRGSFFLVVFAAFVLYLIVKSIVKNVKQQRFRKKNRDTQFFGGISGNPKYVNRAEAIGEY